jgi:hypothetical protein
MQENISVLFEEMNRSQRLFIRGIDTRNIDGKLTAKEQNLRGLEIAWAGDNRIETDVVKLLMKKIHWNNKSTLCPILTQKILGNGQVKKRGCKNSKYRSR